MTSPRANYRQHYEATLTTSPVYQRFNKPGHWSSGLCNPMHPRLRPSSDSLPSSYTCDQYGAERLFWSFKTHCREELLDSRVYTCFDCTDFQHCWDYTDAMQPQRFNTHTNLSCTIRQIKAWHFKFSLLSLSLFPSLLLITLFIKVCNIDVLISPCTLSTI